MGNEQAKVVENHRYPSGNVYSGQMQGGKRHGEGTLTWRDGAVYTGSWISDQCNGFGRMQFPNGSVYEGAWVRNNPHGQGKLKTINAEVLEGFWEFHGRSDRTSTPVGKYQFRGDLVDLKTNQRRQYAGPLALYLLTGLVSLPNMSDPMESILPFAVAMVDEKYDPVTAEHGRMLFQEGMSASDQVPIAHVVQTAPSSSSSINYGQQNEPAFQAKHRDDHATFSLLDPRLYLAGLGVPTQPTNINQVRQNAIRQQQSGQSSNTAVPIAVPVNASAQPGPTMIFN